MNDYMNKLSSDLFLACLYEIGDKKKEYVHTYFDISVKTGYLFSRSTISKQMHVLYKFKYVTKYDKLVRYSTNQKRRVHGYMLTKSGYKHAISVLEKIKKYKIYVINHDSTIIRTNVEKLYYSMKAKIPLTKIFLLLQYDIFDVRKHISPYEAENVTINIPLPVIDIFVGRTSELNVIRQFINGNENILLVHGVEGVGKTTLIQYFLGINNIKYAYINGDKMSSYKSIVLSIIFKAGIEYYSSYREYSSYISKDTFIEHSLFVSKILQSKDITIVIDDYHLFSDNIKKFIEYTIKECNIINKKIKWIIISREEENTLLKFQGCTKLNLQGLRLVNVKELISKKIGQVTDIENIYNKTNGIPLLVLKYIDGTLDTNLKEILNMLSIDEKHILYALSVLEYPIKEEWIKQNFNDKALERLVSKNYIKRYRDRTVLLQKYLQEFIIKNVPKEDIVPIAKKLLSYFETENNVQSSIELLKLYILTNELNSFVDKIVYCGDIVINNGYGIEFHKIINKVLDKDIKNKYVLYYYLGLVLKNEGYYKKAINHLKKSLTMYEMSRDKQIDPINIYFQIVRLYEHLNNIHAVEKYLKSMKLLINKQNKMIALHKYYFANGIMYTLLKDNKKALYMYNKCLLYSKKYKDVNIYINALYEKGRIMELSGHKEKANKIFSQLIKIAEKNNLNYYVGIGYLGKGHCYYKKKRYKKAYEYFHHAVEVFSRMGDSLMFAYALLDESIMLINMKKYEHIEETLRVCVDIFKKIGITNMVSDVKKIMLKAKQDMNKWQN
jgi:tetratricopeptide (TPR) repeat protein